MTDLTRPVAKSLHTVTVIVQVARLHIVHGPFTAHGMPSPEKAVDLAMTTLGLAGRPDPWNTRAQALKQLEAAK